MAALAAGAVVLVRFPFSDLTSSKLRPALVLASAGRGDSILCQITSNPYADTRAVELTDDSFASGGLARVSYIRPGKIFTASETLIAEELGQLRPGIRAEAVHAVVALLRASLPANG